MKVGKYWVRWFHANNQPLNETFRYSKMDKRGRAKELASSTRCEITVKDEAGGITVYGVGEAICQPTDNFCRKTGRKLSLERALIGFSKESKKLFWDEFLK